MIVVEVGVIVARGAALSEIGSRSVAAGSTVLAVDWWAVLVEVSILGAINITIWVVAIAVEVGAITVSTIKRLAATTAAEVVATIGIATEIAISTGSSASGAAVVVPFEVSVGGTIFITTIHQMTIDWFALAILTSLLG